MSWSDYKIWKRKIQRWQKNTDVSERKRADRVMRQLPVELQRMVSVRRASENNKLKADKIAALDAVAADWRSAA